MSNFLISINTQILIGDGAMGTMLVRQGLPAGHNPELWMMEYPDRVKAVHEAYLEAGSRVILTNTFGANRLKLLEYSSSFSVEDINLRAGQLAREAASATAGTKIYIAGCVGPTGHFPAPLGDLPWSELVDVFREQVQALEKSGVDFLFLETFSDLGEIRAALFAAKQYTSLPTACSLTYINGRTLTGTSPAVAAAVLEAMGADLVGANCSTGPKELLEVIKAYHEATRLPLLVEPNAGMPEFINGETVYRETPADMARYVEPFCQLGVKLIGACCGSTPQHIQAMAQSLASLKSLASPSVSIPAQSPLPTRLASRSKIVHLGKGHSPLIIGERINPTARKVIAQAFRDKNWSLLIDEGRNQLDAGALVLDLNVGVPGEEESILMAGGVRQLQTALDTPLVLDSTNPEALEKGLREYQGKALINSVNGEEDSLSAILPLARRYGAAVLGLTLNEKGIPETAEERLAIAQTIVKRAWEYGIPREDILIDCLVLTAATSPALAMETIKAIALVKEHLGVTTVLGLSNVSHGLPQRSWLNSTFLALALGSGLDAAIANPADTRIMETLAAATLLTGRDPGARNYVQLAGKSPGSSAASTVSPGTPAKEEAGLTGLHRLIIQGDQEKVTPLVIELLKQHDVMDIINKGIIPPLEQIGQLYAKGEIYLPQLMLSGDAAKKAFSCLKEAMPERSVSGKGTIIIGTVKGDIHDIGKNITAALLENHGYRVIDLGKNIPAQTFLEAARREKAHIVGLSALMTTTMVEMGPITRLLKESLPGISVIVGGAVVTAEYAREIGADGYGKDAVEAVKVIQALMQKASGGESRK